ncbi:RNase H domain-containing protein [Nephila pilipes]|uniref:RNase H domain-containing protein n=1 Tax=Nephila pilipes TaxID=299642 RepID=A0A8X6N003_NEPPI|nr:RNase H domain-containing protein [Nephila pilipes]
MLFVEGRAAICYYAIQDFDGTISKNDTEAASLFDAHYQKISNLDFSEADRLVKRKASNIVQGCCSKTDFTIPIFSKDFGIHHFDTALLYIDLRKSPGPDEIHICMIDHLGCDARRRILDIINMSWISGLLSRDWKRATVILFENHRKICGGCLRHLVTSFLSAELQAVL